MAVFTFVAPFTLPGAKAADPQIIGEALTALQDEANGELRPGAVVEAAREPSHPLHSHLTWDDAEAAEEHRINQARALIRIVRVVSDDRPEEEAPRAFISVRAPSGVAYRSRQQVVDSLELQLLVLRQAERDLDAFMQRYRDLAELCDLVTIARDKARQRRSEAENRVQ